MKGYGRSHPVSVVFNLGRLFYMLLIPVLRGLISALKGGFPQWLRGAWMDVLVFAAMVFIAALIWLGELFRYDGGHMEISRGLLRRSRVFVPWERASAIILTEPFFLRPLRVVRFRLDTLGGGKDPDISIFLSKTRAEGIIKSRKDIVNVHGGKVLRPSVWSIAALSLLTSNSFGGILFISAFISQAGNLLGKGFSRMIIGTFEEAARSLAFGVPPAAAAIGYILLSGWFIGFLISFCRYKDFTLTRNGDVLAMRGGVFTKREYFIRRPDVNFIDIRQSVTTRLLGLYSLYISVAGYGKREDDISCVIPSEPRTRFRESLGAIFPGIIPAPRAFAPEAAGIMRFIGDPVFCLLAVAAAMCAFLRIFPGWDGFIWFVGLMACVPAVMFLAVRALDFGSAGIAYRDNAYTLRYSRGLSLHTVVIPADKVIRVELRRSLFQKLGPYCDVVVLSRAEGRSVHLCRSLVMKDMIKLFDVKTTG